MRRPQMWHVVWLQGAMEWCETTLAQMKQTSASSGTLSSSAVVLGLTVAAKSRAAGFAGTEG